MGLSTNLPACLQESIAREVSTLIKRQSREIRSQDKEVFEIDHITPGRFSSSRSR